VPVGPAAVTGLAAGRRRALDLTVSAPTGPPAGDPGRRPMPLADASRRLRGRPGRPPTGLGVQSAPLEPAKAVEAARDFALTLLPRGLPLPAAATYSGLPVRALWRLISRGTLAPVRVPGTRRVLLLRDDLDRLLEASKEPA
jgi:hypothetical protein